jgi:copper chaperone CopZ
VNRTTYTVTGMTCDHCVQAVRSEVSAVPGVSDVDVDLASGRVLVSSDGAGPVDDGAVRAAVAEAGYEVTS